MQCKKLGINPEFYRCLPSELDSSLLIRQIISFYIRIDLDGWKHGYQLDLLQSAEVVQSIFHAFCASFRDHVGGGGTGERRAAQNPGLTGLPSATSSSFKGNSKRDRPDDPGRGDDKKRRGGITKSGYGQISKRFACPFFKRNPIRFWNCTTFRNPADVRQHLARTAHQEPLHCPICNLEFVEDSSSLSPDDQYEEHVRQQTCQENPDPPGWITPAQLREIAIRAGEGDTPPKKWYIIWEIVFPDTPHPDSPFCTNPIKEIFQYATRNFTNSPHASQLLTELLPLSSVQQLDSIFTALVQSLPPLGSSASQNTPPLVAQVVSTSVPGPMPTLLPTQTLNPTAGPVLPALGSEFIYTPFNYFDIPVEYQLMDPGLGIMDPGLELMDPDLQLVDPDLQLVDPDLQPMDPDLQLVGPDLQPMDISFEEIPEEIQQSDRFQGQPE